MMGSHWRQFLAINLEVTAGIKTEKKKKNLNQTSSIFVKQKKE